MYIVTMTTTTKPVVISGCFTLRMRLCICYMCDVYIVFYVYMYIFSNSWRFGNKQMNKQINK